MLLEKRAFLKSGSAPRCLIGFDGFTDEIIDVVEVRKSPTSFTPFSSMQAFACQIAQVSGKSCNFELVVREKKIGGNGPILANALLEGGHQITYVGAIGEGTPEPLFKSFAERCVEALPISASGHTDALEFSDGKLILGKLGSLEKMTASYLIEQIGEKRLFDFLERSTLFVSANWTMLPMMNDFWDYLLTHITKKLSSKKRFLFVDLADPAKREDKDLLRACALLKELNRTFDLILGLNAREALRLLTLFQLDLSGDLLDLAKSLEKHLKIQIVIHTPKSAAVATENEAHFLNGPYTSKPFLTTGAGDNFNAGYLNALLYGFDLKAALLSGMATAGYYVRHGKSPTIEELAFFLHSWDNNSL